MKIKLILMILILFSRIAFCQTTNDRNIETNIDSVILKLFNSYEIPGLSVGLIKNNQIIYEKGFGVLNINTKNPINTQSIYHMASVSKPFVATAILQLVEKGKICLDSTLVTYIPYFTMADERYKLITIRHILTHSSGIPDVKDYEWNKPQYDNEAAERFAKSFSKSKLEFTPGEESSYCNAAFDILADVISKVSGISFEKYMKKNILKPCGMKNSTFFKNKVPSKYATSPHVIGSDFNICVSDIYPYNRIHAPSSTLHSNIVDMLKWSEMYLNQGKYDNRQVINRNSYKLLTSPEMRFGESDSVCLSWFSDKFEGKRIFYHNGGDVGYSTFIGFIPEDSIAIFVMANCNSINRLARTIAYSVLAKSILNIDKEYWKEPIYFELRKLILYDSIGKFKEQYNFYKKSYPEKYDFGAWNLDYLGYRLIDRKKYKEASEIFQFNIDLFPNNANWYDSLGDAYRAWGNAEMAIKWYKSALEINPKRTGTQRKLEKLTQVKSE